MLDFGCIAEVLDGAQGPAGTSGEDLYVHVPNPVRAPEWSQTFLLPHLPSSEGITGCMHMCGCTFLMPCLVIHNPAALPWHEHFSGAKLLVLIAGTCAPAQVFDYVPPELISLFVTDTGGYTPSYVYRLLAEYFSREDYTLSKQLLESIIR